MPYLPASPRSALSLSITRALLTGLLSTSPLLIATSAQAQSVATQQTRVYAIPAGDLDGALNRFASEADILLSVDSRLTAGKRSAGLSGSHSVDAGLAQLLAGTGLRPLKAGDNYALEAAVSSGSSLELGATSINANGLGDTTEGSGSYTTGAVTIGKGQHSLKDTPQSVTVMTRKMLDDQNLNTIEQVMEKTPGITVYDSPMGGKYFYSRGFRMTGQYQYDGVPLDIGSSYAQADSFSSDMAIYDLSLIHI